jgi:hypothetical protein
VKILVGHFLQIREGHAKNHLEGLLKADLI